MYISLLFVRVKYQNKPDVQADRRTRRRSVSVHLTSSSVTSSAVTFPSMFSVLD